MKRTAVVLAALILLAPAWTLIPFFTTPGIGAASDGPVFSRDYTSYALDMQAGPSQPDQVSYILNGYSITNGGSSVLVFDRLGVQGFQGSGTPVDSETMVRYADSALDFRLHNTPTAAIEIALAAGGKVYVDMAGGMSALKSGSGVIVGGNNVSGVIVVSGSGVFSVANDFVIVQLAPASKMVFRATPPGEAQVSEGILSSRISGEMYVSSTPGKVLQGGIAYGGAGMEALLTSNNSFSASVNGSIGGKVMVINLDRGMMPDIDSRKIAVSVSGADAQKSENAAAIVWETGGEAKYFVSIDGEILQILVYVPADTGTGVISISEHVDQGPGLDTVMSAIAATLVVVVAAAALYKR
ncbi:MAG: hypothetical protein HZB92_08930 [Euryarchaeota archaeon]|nr:hypothetical protein [Euryarchaeota archaeon]